ncbi:MAG TPA: PspA/IM30 family protein [Planctomycetaceae bacterium]|nr:PspA/IM30 family protein [Planctomycetaceae bacterium]
MKWLERFTFVMRSNITTLREKIEHPERMLHQLIVDMEDELAAVRHSVAEAIADEIQLRKRAGRAGDEARQWAGRAEQALQRGDEDAARAALDQKLLAEDRATALEDEHRKQKEQTAKLQASVGDLEGKIRQARQKRTLLIARLTRAEAGRRINATLDRVESRSAFAEFQRLEDKVERAEAFSEACERLEGRDPDAAELERQFAEDERKERVRREFEELKSRLGGNIE